MALVKTTVKKSIKDMLEEVLLIENSAESLDTYADRLAELIIDTIKSGDVVVATAIPVTVVVATGIGATTAPGSGSIS
jgi:hypothetical protein